MAKVREEARKQYFGHLAPHKKSIVALQLNDASLSDTLDENNPNDAYKRFALVMNQLAIFSHYLIMNSLSMVLLGIRNENALNDARKCCYKVIIQLEKIFTNRIDVPFSDYEESLACIASYPEMKRFETIKKTGFAIAQMRDSLNENSRWKWSIIELEARLATIAKNSLDLKSIVQGMDPRSKGCKERIAFFNLTRKLLQKAADDYRLKYEVSTEKIDDFQIAISYLGALQRLSLLTGRQNEAVELKRKIKIWKEKMVSDEQEREKNSSNNRRT